MSTSLTWVLYARKVDHVGAVQQPVRSTAGRKYRRLKQGAMHERITHRKMVGVVRDHLFHDSAARFTAKGSTPTSAISKTGGCRGRDEEEKILGGE
jgi:hypothetical protein